MSKTNFDYLQNIDKNLYEIINDAEKLYRGEFFEQCMGQTRRFGEHICRNLLGKNRTNEITFDEMLATLKDKISGFEQEKEFINDLYYLKKNGNISVHSDKVQHSATTALECLQRSFEVGINYAVYNKKANPDILKLCYDTELLITGHPSKKTLSQKYLEAKKNCSNSTLKNKKTQTSKPKKKQPQVSSIKSVPQNNKLKIFWVLVGVFLIISLITAIYLIL